jgi:hypothetical protein
LINPKFKYPIKLEKNSKDHRMLVIIFDYSRFLGTDPEILSKTFPDIEFSHLDSLHWLEHLAPEKRKPNALVKEAESKFHERLAEFCLDLEKRKEKLIILVSHSKVYKFMLNKRIGQCGFREIKKQDLLDYAHAIQAKNSKKHTTK